jgi:hypothetical protein
MFSCPSGSLLLAPNPVIMQDHISYQTTAPLTRASEYIYFKLLGSALYDVNKELYIKRFKCCFQIDDDVFINVPLLAKVYKTSYFSNGVNKNQSIKNASHMFETARINAFLFIADKWQSLLSGVNFINIL